jgi:hypothetical protein
MSETENIQMGLLSMRDKSTVKSSQKRPQYLSGSRVMNGRVNDDLSIVTLPNDSDCMHDLMKVQEKNEPPPIPREFLDTIINLLLRQAPSIQ